MTDATRQKRARDKRKAEGLVLIRAWVPAAKADAVRAAITAALQAPEGERE